MRQLPPILATLGLAVAGRSALAQIDIKAATSMDGHCRAEINGQTATCQPFGTVMEFGNGRSLFLFSREGTAYAFSGSRSQQRDAQTFA